MSTIDSLLYRPLHSGTAYKGLIPAYKGTDHKFDKNSDNSTTYDTLRFMAQWSNKYSYQMAKVAPLLKGKSIEETANNIYQFLYNHFQYKLDGELQNLYSPSAAWHFRQKGFDCKTYSILASTILNNLGITHAFRMVQQQGIMPGEWSHVYVVIPNGNQDAIIDATTHTNLEVSYTKKHDYIMKHRGLASPYINGLGCACQGKPITRTGLGNPNILATTITNFHLFLNELETKGVSRQVTNNMLELVKLNVQKGIDPNMHEIITKAYAGTAQGLGSTLTDFSYQAGTAIGNINVSGVNVGTTANQLANGNYIAAGLSVLKAIIPLENTFGAVFANGFDLSCWGASYSEQEAKPQIEKDMPFMVSWSGITTTTNTANYNRFMLITEAYLKDARNGQQSKYASCTRKGHALREKATLTLRQNIQDAMTTSGFQLTPTGKQSATMELPQGLPGYRAGSRWGYQSELIPYDSFSVTATQPVTPSPDPTQTVVTNADGTQTVVNTPVAKAKKSSSLLLPILAAGGLAIKFLI